MSEENNNQDQSSVQQANPSEEQAVVLKKFLYTYREENITPVLEYLLNKPAKETFNLIYLLKMPSKVEEAQ